MSSWNWLIGAWINDNLPPSFPSKTPKRSFRAKIYAKFDMNDLLFFNKFKLTFIVALQIQSLGFDHIHFELFTRFNCPSTEVNTNYNIIE